MELKIHPNDKMTPVERAKAIAEKRDYDKNNDGSFFGRDKGKTYRKKYKRVLEK